MNGFLVDPVLSLRDSAGNILEENDDWSVPNGQAILATGFAPARRIESAIVRTLAPGAYTALVTGFNGVTGVSVVEVYELP